MKTETLSKTEYLQTLLHNPTVVGLTIIEYLEPMAGAGRKIQPATYAPERKGDPSRYNINKSNVATIDSVQSQANRLEPIFTQPPYSALVPQIVIEQDGHPPVNLLEVGHRFVDAVVRYANAPEIRAVLDALKGGDFTALAKLNPTAIILGFDDRSFSSLKQPRSLVSEIEAKVEAEYTRFTQYNSSASDALKEAAQELIDSGEASEKKVSEFNLDDVPNENPNGGVQASEIRRIVTFEVNILRRQMRNRVLLDYALGLGLVMFAYPVDLALRSGTNLVGDSNRPPVTQVVYRNGKREAIDITHEDALAFAQDAATAFGVGKNQTFTTTPQTFKAFVDSLKPAEDKKVKKSKKAKGE